MPSIDKRVVEMQFNNRQFESGVSTTLKSLQNLKEGLNFKKSVQDLNQLQNAGNKFNLSGMAKGIEAIQSRFTALGIVGVNVISNLTNSAVNAGKRIASALTIDPIKTGFQEYETQINAVQTILANTQSKGTNLKQVTAALDELNRYADMTIYNFTEMTRNIGTFTAAGVDLDTSVSAIKGIANLAAISGSTSQQASTAMYQLSQALAAGKVQLMDWNSVVNAGMGGQVFQDALKETARVHGVKIDEMIAKEGSFRETLRNGWLTSAILTETLAKFTGDLTEEQLRAIGYNDEQIAGIIKMGQTANDAATKVKTFTQLFDTLKEAAQSGWAQSWKIIVGDFEEAKETLTKLSDIFSGLINDSASARNTILQEWSNLGGRKDLFDGILSSVEAVLSLIKPIREGFREIIPPITGQNLADLTKGFKEFAEGLKLSEENSNKVKNISKNIATVFNVILNVLKGIGQGLPEFVKGLGDFGSGLLSVVESLTGFLAGITKGINLSGVFSTVMSGLGKVLTLVGQGFSFISTVISAAVNGIVTFFSYLGSGFTNLTAGFGSAMQGAEGAATSGFGTIGDIIKSFFTNIKEFAVDVVRTLPELVGTAITSIGEAISNILNSLNIKGILDTVNAALTASLIVDVKNILKRFKDTEEETEGILDKFLEGPIEKIGEVLDTVKNSLNAFATSIKINMLLKVAISMGILAASLWALSKIPVYNLGTSLGMLSVGMLLMSAILIKVLTVLKDMSKSAKNMTAMIELAFVLRSVATSLTILSVAVLILSKSIEVLGRLRWQELVKGLGSLAVITGILIAFVNLIKEVKGIEKTAASLILLGIAMKVFASSIEQLGKLNITELVNGLMGLGAALGMLVAAVYGFSKVGSMSIKSAAGLLVLAIALKVISSSVTELGSKSLGELARGLIALYGSLVILISAIDSLKIDPKTAGSFVIFAAGIGMVSDSVQKLGSMSIKEIAKSLIALYGSMLVIVKAMNNMMIDPKTAVSFGIFAMGLSAMIVPIKVLGDMDIKSMAQGLLGLAATLLIVQTAARKLGSMSKKILSLSKSLAIFGAAMIAFGIGLTAIVHPIKLLGEMGQEKLVSSVVGISIVIFALYELMQVLDNMPAISLKTVATLGLMVVVVGILSLILDMMSMVDTDSALKASQAITMVLLSISATLAVLSLLPIPAAMSAVGTLTAVIAAMAAIVAAAGGIAQIPGAKWLVSEGKAFLQSIGEAIGGFFGGIAGGAITAVASSLPGLGSQLSAFAENAKPFFDSMSGFDPGVAEGVKNLAIAFLALTGAGILDAATSWLTGGTDMSEFGRQLAEFGPYLKTFADSVAGIDGASIESAANAAKSLSEMANNLPKSGGLAQIFTGEGNLLQFAQQLTPFGEALVSYGNIVTGINSEAIQASVSAAQGLSDLANALPKTGGLAQVFTGEGNILEFAQQLPAFGLALKLYGAVVSGIDAGSIQASAQAAQGLVDVYNSLAPSGGLVQWFTGEQDFSSFATNVALLGVALATYGASVANLQSEKIQASVQAAQAIAEVQNSLGKEGGVAGWWEGGGSEALSGFASALGTLGDGIKNYGNAVSQGSFENVQASIDAVQRVKDVLQNMNDFNNEGIIKFTNTIGNLGDFGLSTFNEALGQAAGGVAGSMQSLADAISNGAGQIGTAIDNLKAKLQAEPAYYQEAGRVIGFALMTGVGNGVEQGTSGAVEKVRSACNQMINAIQDAFKDQGRFRAIGSGIVNSIASGIGNPYNRFYNYGVSMAHGLRDGINNSKWSAINAAIDMANKAAEFTRRAIDSHSPSKVFAAIGKTIPWGLSVGIDKWSNMVVKPVRSMAQRTIDVAKTSLAKVEDLITNPTPTTASITPVYTSGAATQLNANTLLTSRLASDLSQVAKKISKDQNGSSSVVNNYHETKVMIDGATINDFPAMRQATKDYLVELSRLGAM